MTATLTHTKTRLEPTWIAPDTYIIHDHEGEGTAPVLVPLNSLVIRGKEPVVIDTGMATVKSADPMLEPDVGKVIPSSLQDSLTARLDRLGDAKETAQLAAVIGSGFRPQMLHAVGSLGYERVEVVFDDPL